MSGISEHLLDRLSRNLQNLSEELWRAVSEKDQLSSELASAKRDMALLKLRQAPFEAAPRAAATSKPRAAVVAWDLGHNPAGRAHVLCDLLSDEWDVDLIGPLWKRYGKEIWSPLKDLDIRTRSFRATELFDFLPKAIAEAATTKYDLVYVSKPRLPALIIGNLIKQRSGCPLVLDIDDHELSFFLNRSALDIAEIPRLTADDLREPYEELGTRLGESLIAEADAITVSNVALRERFGGHIVRHARDESIFFPGAFDGRQVRKEMGIGANEFALVFVGTPRPHKGIFEVAQALHELGDPDISFNIIGDFVDRRLKAEVQKFTNAKIRLFPNSSFSDLPRILSAADAVPLLQDVSHPVAKFQIPAKISDATALGKLVLTTNVPPLRDLIAQGGIKLVEPGSLKHTLAALKAQKASGLLPTDRIREFFLDELSFSVNRARLKAAIAGARQRNGHASHAGLSKLQEHATKLVIEHARKSAVLSIARRPSPQAGAVDVVFFWKQNDSGLYGRRSDMVIKHLLSSGRVRRLLQFDAPIDVRELNALTASHSANSQAQLVLRNSLARWKNGLDTQEHLQRLYIYSDAAGVLLDGKELPPRSGYVDWVIRQIAEAGMTPDQTISWVCPVVWDYPQIADRFPFRLRVADIIDDQRAWKAAPKYLSRLDICYRSTLERADVAFANCFPVADAFRDHGRHIHVIPNGAECFERNVSASRPIELGHVRGPIIGYVGNLRDRIDWALLQEVISQRQDWNFVFAGSTDGSAKSLELAPMPNVTFLGVVEYARLPDFLRHFDVGIVPHEDDAVTKKMNPLKVYNYFSARLPVVTTKVSNLQEMEPFVRTAEGATEFIFQIERALAAPPYSEAEHAETMARISWHSRVSEMLKTVDSAMARPSEAPAFQ